MMKVVIVTAVLENFTKVSTHRKLLNNYDLLRSGNSLSYVNQFFLRINNLLLAYTRVNLSLSSEVLIKYKSFERKDPRPYYFQIRKVL